MQLLIYGAGGFGREVLNMASAHPDSPYSQIDFIDDQKSSGSEVDGCRVLGGIDTLQSVPRDSARVVIAVGNPALRAALWEKISAERFLPATIIDPAAIVRPSAQLGQGLIIAARVFISCGVVLADNVAVNVGALIGHDVKIGSHSVISPLVSLLGYVTVGQQAEMGTSSTVLPGTTIGDRVRVSVNAAVLKDVPPDVTVAGVPARIMAKRS